MDISNACSVDFEELSPETSLSKVRGVFDENAETRVVVLTDDDGFQGVVTRKQLLASKHSPDEKASSARRHPPRVSRTEDVRETARLMVESGLDLLPVFEGDQFYGVVTARGLLAEVEPYLDALDIADVYSSDLITAEPETTLGEIIHRLREYGISRIPIVDEDDDAVGMVSVYDLVDFTVREMNREQGGSTDGFDEHGGQGSGADYQTHGGFGERAGFAARMLDLPARNVMTTPVRTARPEIGLDEAVDRMLENGHSSLVVQSGGAPAGIVTKTDILRSLTWTAETHMPVQIFGVDLMGLLDRTDVADRLEEIGSKYQEMDILEATVIFQEHSETHRGTPLVRTTVRLFTDRGIYSGTNEEYGAQPAFDQAAEILERNVLEDKGRNRPERQPEDKRERSARLVEWWLEP